MTTVKKLYEKAFKLGIKVQIREQSGLEVDGRAIWNQLESDTKDLKDRVLTHSDKVLLYNDSLKSIYYEMNKIILRFQMDKSEFDPKSNHFFCQLMNLVDKKSNFEIKINKIMQLGFNAGQLSVFLERLSLPEDRIFIMTNFIESNNMLELETYVSKETQDIINNHYLKDFKGGKYNLIRRHSIQNKKRRSIKRSNLFQ